MKTRRYLPVKNSFGGYTQEWSDNVTFEGVIDLLTGGQSTSQQKISEDSTHILICEEIFDIKMGDRVIANGKWYDVTFVDEPFGHHLEVELKYRGLESEQGDDTSA